MAYNTRAGLGNAASYGATGFSMGGPVGAAIGAGLGLASGFMDDGSDAENQRYEEARRAYEQNLAAGNAEMRAGLSSLTENSTAGKNYLIGAGQSVIDDANALRPIANRVGDTMEASGNANIGRGSELYGMFQQGRPAYDALMVGRGGFETMSPEELRGAGLSEAAIQKIMSSRTYATGEADKASAAIMAAKAANNEQRMRYGARYAMGGRMIDTSGEMDATAAAVGASNGARSAAMDQGYGNLGLQEATARNYLQPALSFNQQGVGQVTGSLAPRTLPTSMRTTGYELGQRGYTMGNVPGTAQMRFGSDLISQGKGMYDVMNPKSDVRSDPLNAGIANAAGIFKGDKELQSSVKGWFDSFGGSGQRAGSNGYGIIDGNHAIA